MSDLRPRVAGVTVQVQGRVPRVRITMLHRRSIRQRIRIGIVALDIAMRRSVADGRDGEDPDQCNEEGDHEDCVEPPEMAFCVLEDMPVGLRRSWREKRRCHSEGFSEGPSWSLGSFGALGLRSSAKENWLRPQDWA